jgi:hypothetical protein
MWLAWIKRPLQMKDTSEAANPSVTLIQETSLSITECLILPILQMLTLLLEKSKSIIS